jgi:hypothetical protein
VSVRPAEPSAPPMAAAAAAADRSAARAGADRPGRRWLLKVKFSRSFFRRGPSRQLISRTRPLTRRSVETLLDLLRESPRVSDPAALRRVVAAPPVMYSPSFFRRGPSRQLISRMRPLTRRSVKTLLDLLRESPRASDPAALRRVVAAPPVMFSPSFFRRGPGRQLISWICPLTRRSVETLLDLLRGSPRASDPAALCRGLAAPLVMVRVSLHGAVLAAFGLGVSGTIVLHMLITSGAITTHQDYFGVISFCFTELRRFLAAARDVWDVCSSLLWLWEDMQCQPQEQQLQPSAAVQVISAPPPPELDIC